MKILRYISFICLSLISILVAGQNFVEVTSKKEFQESADNHINSAVLTADGYHVVTGYTYNNSKGGKDIWVICFSRRAGSKAVAAGASNLGVIVPLGVNFGFHEVDYTSV